MWTLRMLVSTYFQPFFFFFFARKYKIYVFCRFSQNKGQTALHFCSMFGFDKIRVYLINVAGADESIRNQDGLTHLEAAKRVKENHRRIISKHNNSSCGDNGNSSTSNNKDNGNDINNNESDNGNNNSDTKSQMKEESDRSSINLLNEWARRKF